METDAAGPTGPGANLPDEPDHEPLGCFTADELCMLELKAAGYSNDAAGAPVNRSGKTVQRLLQRPEARRYVNELMLERLEEVRGELGQGLLEAARVARAELDADAADVRLRAVGLLLRSHGDVRAAAVVKATIEDLVDKVADLKRTVAEVAGDVDG